MTDTDRPNLIGRPLVLVVDDDPDLRTLASLQLQTDDFDVIEAGSGEECIDLALDRRPDVILLDVQMPRMDGREALDKLMQHPDTKDIPVIFLSAFASVEDRVLGLEKGAVDYIAKPVDRKELLARVRVAARTSARRRELHQQLALDPATGLPGHGAFVTRLGEEVARSHRSSAALSLLLLDIDDMTAINKALGTTRGDELIAGVASTLRATLRNSDLLFRLGGDEFACIMPDSPLPTAIHAAERCRSALRVLAPLGSPLTVSIGIAEISGGRGAPALLERSRAALSKARDSGGDRTWRADDPRRRAINPLALSANLTPREWDILAHLSNGRTEIDIARRLGIRPGTVRSHKARIRRKLNIAPDTRLTEFAKANYDALAAHQSPMTVER